MRKHKTGSSRLSSARPVPNGTELGKPGAAKPGIGRLGTERLSTGRLGTKTTPETRSALPAVATALRIWQHSCLLPITELEEDLQDRILILRNHPDVCAMSHNQNIISYAAHQDYLRELKRRRPLFDCCALYCDAIRLLKETSAAASVHAGAQSTRINDAGSSLKVLRPIIGMVSVDMRLPERPLLGLYKNLYHYPHIKLGRTLLFAAMLRASELGLREVFMECYSQNLPVQKLARNLGFLPQSTNGRARHGNGSKQVLDSRGELLSYQRYLPSSKKLLQEPMFADLAELQKEAQSLGLTAGRRVGK